MSEPVELYSRREGKETEMLIDRFLKLIPHFDQSKELKKIPLNKRSYKNTFGHLTNFHCQAFFFLFFLICFLSFVRLRLPD